jgi:hypothetical protein
VKIQMTNTTNKKKIRNIFLFSVDFIIYYFSFFHEMMRFDDERKFEKHLFQKLKKINTSDFFPNDDSKKPQFMYYLIFLFDR